MDMRTVEKIEYGSASAVRVPPDAILNLGMGVDRETGFGKTITGLLKPFFLTPAEGAATAIYLATDDAVSHISGVYFYKCWIAKSSKRSKSRKLAKRLYELSEEMVRE